MRYGGGRGLRLVFSGYNNGPTQMVDMLNTYKPGGSARVHLFLAALMWTAVGLGLSSFGGRWVLAGRSPYAPLLLTVAVTIGLLKARFVLDGAAGKMIQRIRIRGDGRCIGGFLSVRSWMFVALMMGAGRLLRGGPLPRMVVGLVYVAVGVGLLLASRRLWAAWGHHDSDL